MNLKTKVTRSFGRKVLLAKKNSPHIFFGVGVAGVVTGTVLACKATLKLEETLDEIEKDLDKVRNASLDELREHTHSNAQGDVKLRLKLDRITEKDRERLLALKRGRGAVKLVKLYAPAIIVTGSGIALLTGSHVQMTRRNSALSATLALVSKSFDDYRERVRKELGEEKEMELACLEDVEIEENGKTKTVKVLNPGGLSPYARCFNAQNNADWKPNTEYNRLFIQCQQEYANHRLRKYGFVMLNDVYEALGFDRTTPGSVVGWVLNGDGDNYIDFGIYRRPDAAQFTIGEEYDVWLDFNVDGEVYHLIDKVSGVR